MVVVHSITLMPYDETEIDIINLPPGAVCKAKI